MVWNTVGRMSNSRPLLGFKRDQTFPDFNLSLLTIQKLQGEQMQSATENSDETQKQPPALIVIGMAGSGKTTFMQVSDQGRFGDSVLIQTRSNPAIECPFENKEEISIHSQFRSCRCPCPIRPSHWHPRHCRLLPGHEDVQSGTERRHSDSSESLYNKVWSGS